MKKFFALAVVFFFLTGKITSAQNSTKNHAPELHQYTDSLRLLNDTMLDGNDEQTRVSACFSFIRVLVKALKQENSFDDPFDSLTRIAILYPEDRSFRIFNWVVPLGETERFYGVIQMNDSKTILFPFFDYSDHIQNQDDTVTSNEKWIGALYYKILEVKTVGKSYYTLLGWNGNNFETSRKSIDILWFKPDGKPQFGAPVFQFEKDQYPNSMKRFMIAYKEGASISLNYDDHLKMIVFDHLVPEQPNQTGMYAHYVPDGTYEGFHWQNGKWRYTENVFTGTQKEAPVPKPLNENEKNPELPK